MLQVRISDDRATVVRVLSALVEHIDELLCGSWLAESLVQITQDDSYRFVAADDEHSGPLAAAGVITFFLQPMAETHVLAVEALWFRDDEFAAQLPVWQALVAFSQRMEFGGVCISSRSTNAAKGLRELAERGALDGCPVTVSQLPLQKQGNSSPVRSTFSNDAITAAAFISLPAVVVHTRKTQIDLSGREYVGSAPLYRGEGRLECLPHWKCDTLDELAAQHFAKGFYARPRTLPAGSTVPFGGTIAEQLLHQGYVGQGAVSLSTSFQVAATYANHACERKEALVFTVDTERLARHTKIFDSTATLSAACPWIPREAWVSLRRMGRSIMDRPPCCRALP
jgi:hypothetical protein